MSSSPERLSLLLLATLSFPFIPLERAFFVHLLFETTVRVKNMTQPNHQPNVAASITSPTPSTTSSAPSSTTRSTPHTTPSRTPTPTPSSYPKPTPPPGLVNLGNTCYLNSVLQILYHIPPFRTSLLAPSPPPLANPSFSHTLTSTLRQIFLQLTSAQTALAASQPDPSFEENIHYIAPEALISLLRDESLCTEFDARGQQDAHELLRFLLDKLSLPRPNTNIPRSNPSPKRPRRHPPNIVSSLFEGRALTATRCDECESHSTRSESFLDLSLPVEPDRSLAWAMSTQCAAERLYHRDKYFCEFCNTYTEARRWWLLSALPTVFTIHLKLFAYGARLSGPGGKVGVAMPCPMTVSLAEWCTVDCLRREDVYKLTGVIVHEGNGASSGHYYSYVCHQREGQWFCCDDSFVSHVSEEEVRLRLFTSMKTRRTAYLLFYTNVNQLPAPVA